MMDETVIAFAAAIHLHFVLVIDGTQSSNGAFYFLYRCTE